MCWSGEASLTLAAVGLGATVYAAHKKESPLLWMTLGYFSLMELLQGFTYSVIDECGLPSNQIATLFGYLHIAFQPFFINALAMYFVPEHVRKKISIPVYSLCFVSAIIMLIQLYPFDWPLAAHCVGKYCALSVAAGILPGLCRQMALETGCSMMIFCSSPAGIFPMS